MALILLLFAAFGWGLAGIFIRLLPMYTSHEIVALRFLVAFVLLSFVFISKPIYSKLLYDLKHYSTWLLALIILCCYYVGTAAFAIAPIGETTLLMATAPLFVTIYFWFKDGKILSIKKVGLLLSILGVLFFFVFSISVTSYTLIHFYGNLLALAVSAMFSLYVLLYSHEKIYSPSSLNVTYAMFLLALIPSGYDIFGKITMQKDLVILIDNFAFIFLLGILSTALPTFFITIASKVLSPEITTGVLLLETIFGTLIAYIVLNEIPSIIFIISLSLILIGLILIVYKPLKA